MEGTYSFTYFGSLGGGIGVMKATKISEAQFSIVGHDMLNTRYMGIMTVNPISEDITIDFEMDVPRDVMLVQGTAPHEFQTKKTNLQAKFPPRFESDAPVKCTIAPGYVYVGIRRIIDQFSPVAVDGFPPAFVEMFYGWE